MSPETAEFMGQLPKELQLLGELQKFALENYGEEALPSAWEEFSLWKNRPLDPMEEPELHSIFMTWFVFHWVPKHHRFPSVPVAKRYLETHGDHLSADLGTFIRKALHTPYRFFQVMGHEPQSTQPQPLRSLYDLFLEREVSIPEPSLGPPMEEGEIWFSLLLPVGGKPCFLSSAPTRIPPSLQDLLLFYREDMKSRLGPLDEACLLKQAVELRTLYYEARDKVRATTRLPQNSDGDDFVPLRAYYSLHCSLTEAVSALLPLLLEEKLETPLQKAGFDPDASTQLLRFPLLQKGNPKHPNWPSTTIGWLEMEEGFLNFYTNSEERAEAIHEEIEKLLGDRALYNCLEDLDPETYRDQLMDSPGIHEPPTGRK